MKRILFLLVVGLAACDPPVIDDSGYGTLGFSHVQTTRTTTTSAGIQSSVQVSGSNLCYSFTNFQVLQLTDRSFNVFAKGQVPTSQSICAQAIYTKDTTLLIPVTQPGSYIVNFMNPLGLFRSDTIQVN
ncbi:MAG: hypothetical protein JWP27_2220 [Flaviaesturariibacter sp.]|nr:hypothetical protein [Flaviaesturariibacter sp.]